MSLQGAKPPCSVTVPHEATYKAQFAGESDGLRVLAGVQADLQDGPAQRVVQREFGPIVGGAVKRKSSKSGNSKGKSGKYKRNALRVAEEAVDVEAAVLPKVVVRLYRHRQLRSVGAVICRCHAY